MDICDGLDQGRKELVNLGQRQWTALQMAREGTTLYVRSNNEETALLLSKLEQRQDMFMLQVRADLGLTQEALARHRIMHQVRTDNFDGHFTIEGSTLVSQVDL